jgi:hypothetical protein
MNPIEKLRKYCEDNGGQLPLSDILSFGEELLSTLKEELKALRQDCFIDRTWTDSEYIDWYNATQGSYLSVYDVENSIQVLIENL